ncbi:hypothetical protein ACWY4P_06090 [Streptomyces sp. LZ34]
MAAGASYTSGAPGTAAAAARLMAGTGVREPYRTVTFNDAVFGESGDTLAVEGAGADLWGGTNEFGAIYRSGALGADSTATVRVVSQDATGGWARAGLIVRNDLAANGSAGYVNLAVTPSNGCALSWDTGEDGTFDSVAVKGSFAAPVQLRLTRSGGMYTGECSADGGQRVERRPRHRRIRGFQGHLTSWVSGTAPRSVWKGGPCRPGPRRPGAAPCWNDVKEAGWWDTRGAGRTVSHASWPSGQWCAAA